MFKDRKILEISCGCGLVSMTLSLIDVKLIIATELEDILNTNTKNNIILNNLEKKNNIKLLPLEWNNNEHIKNLFKLYPKLDFIILSECLYEEAPFDKLLQTLIKLSKFYTKESEQDFIEIFFIYKKRYKFQDLCMEKLKKFFYVHPIQRKEIHKDFCNNDNYQFYKLKLINNLK